jgi:hypothetical protein
MPKQMISFILSNDSPRPVPFLLFGTKPLPAGCTIECDEHQEKGSPKRIPYEDKIMSLLPPGSPLWFSITFMRKTLIRGKLSDLLEPATLYDPKGKTVWRIIWSINPIQFQNNTIEIYVKEDMRVYSGSEFQITLQPETTIQLSFIADGNAFAFHGISSTGIQTNA